MRSTFGQKGGEGPTRGKRATCYNVTLPNGRIVEKRVFDAPADPVGFAYEFRGEWILATVRERGSMPHYTECPAKEVRRA